MDRSEASRWLVIIGGAGAAVAAVVYLVDVRLHPLARHCCCAPLKPIALVSGSWTRGGYGGSFHRADKVVWSISRRSRTS